jgi:hypothetical protein
MGTHLISYLLILKHIVALLVTTLRVAMTSRTGRGAASNPR